MIIVLHILTALFVIATIAPLIRRGEWWIRAFDFPFVQFTVFGLVCTVGWVLIGIDGWDSQLSFAVVVGLFLYRLYVIYPYTTFKKPTLPKSNGEKNGFKLLSANVLMSNRAYDRFLKMEEKADPDVLLLVEVDNQWKDAVDDKVREKYPHIVHHPLDNTYGIMIYSKLEIRNEKVDFIIEDDVPSIHCDMKLPSGEWVRFFGIHPKPPAPDQNDTSTPRDAELVLVGRQARKQDMPVIVAGDMNDVAWSHTTRLFMRISGLLDPRMGRGFFNTFHSEKPLLRWPLDHVFLSHHFKINGVNRLENFGSDHYPILVDIVYAPTQEAKNGAEEPDEEDEKEADRKVALAL